MRSFLWRESAWSDGLALQVRDLGRLLVGAALGVGELVLLLTLALIQLPLAPGSLVAGQIADDLLDLSSDLVGDAAHRGPPWSDSPPLYPRGGVMMRAEV